MHFYKLAYEWDIPGGGVADEGLYLGSIWKFTQEEWEELVLSVVPAAYRRLVAAGTGHHLYPRELYPHIADELVEKHQFVKVESVIEFAPSDNALNKPWSHTRHWATEQREWGLFFRIQDAIAGEGFVIQQPAPAKPGSLEAVGETIAGEIVHNLLKEDTLTRKLLPFRPVE